MQHLTLPSQGRSQRLLSLALWSSRRLRRIISAVISVSQKRLVANSLRISLDRYHNSGIAGALATLQWALQVKPDLVPVLIKLVRALLVGHVLDPKLDMTRLLNVGLTPVFGALIHTDMHPSHRVTKSCLRYLARVLVRRLTTDRHAFEVICGDRAHELSEGLLDGANMKYPAVAKLYLLLCKLPMCSVTCNLLLVGADLGCNCVAIASHLWRPLPPRCCLAHVSIHTVPIYVFV